MSSQDQGQKDLMLDVSQAHELKMAFRRNGWTNGNIKTLCKGSILKDILAVIRGQAEIKLLECLVDCDAAPFVPDGWTIEEHRSGGQLDFNDAKVKLYLSKEQKKGFVVGNDLRKELSDKPVYNANLLDWLLVHPERIPNDCKGKNVFFWGTVYRDAGGRLCVRYLYWLGSRWLWSFRWLGDYFSSRDPAAVANLVLKP